MQCLFSLTVKVPASEPINKAASIASLDAFPSLADSRNMPDVPTTKLVPKIAEETQRKKKREGKRRDRDHRLEGLIRGYFGAEYECPQGHRFLSCGEGKVCKLGHKGHPKVRQHFNFSSEICCSVTLH